MAAQYNQHQIKDSISSFRSFTDPLKNNGYILLDVPIRYISNTEGERHYYAVMKGKYSVPQLLYRQIDPDDHCTILYKDKVPIRVLIRKDPIPVQYILIRLQYMSKNLPDFQRWIR